MLDERGRWYSRQCIEELCLEGPLLVAVQFNDRDLSGNGEFWTCTDSLIIGSARRDRAPSTLCHRELGHVAALIS